jgi:hypothetical protein
MTPGDTSAALASSAKPLYRGRKVPIDDPASTLNTPPCPPPPAQTSSWIAHVPWSLVSNRCADTRSASCTALGMWGSDALRRVPFLVPHVHRHLPGRGGGFQLAYCLGPAQYVPVAPHCAGVCCDARHSRIPPSARRRNLTMCCSGRRGRRTFRLATAARRR